MMIQNPWKIRDAHDVAFFDMEGQQTSWTGDRREFLGTYGDLSAPSALSVKAALSNRIGAGLDPCSALQTRVVLAQVKPVK